MNVTHTQAYMTTLALLGGVLPNGQPTGSRQVQRQRKRILAKMGKR